MSWTEVCTFSLFGSLWLICWDSDLHTYRGIEPSAPGPIMGHEFMGEIVEIGSAVKTLQNGDRVVSAFTTSWYAIHLAYDRVSSLNSMTI